MKTWHMTYVRNLYYDYVLEKARTKFCKYKMLLMTRILRNLPKDYEKVEPENRHTFWSSTER